jgi:hypothetical protein
VPSFAAALSQSQFDELTRQAEAGNEAARQLAAQRRDGIIATALSQGRLAPAEREVWRAELDANEIRTVTLLAALEPTQQANGEVLFPTVVDLTRTQRSRPSRPTGSASRSGPRQARRSSQASGSYSSGASGIGLACEPGSFPGRGRCGSRTLLPSSSSL